LAQSLRKLVSADETVFLLEEAEMPMDAALQAQIGTYLLQLNRLIERGRELHDLETAHPSDSSVAARVRHWQNDCGIIINELSGGSKAHWLARAFSGAFLAQSETGHAVVEVAPEEIVSRLIGVLEKAASSLSEIKDRGVATAQEAPMPHRFDFVHDAKLRPVLEQAYNDSRSALNSGKYSDSLMNSCGVLEAIVTDALEHCGLGILITLGAPADKISEWSFETRLTVAERAGLIRGGCARLPGVARAYRESGTTVEASERDARVTGQVLHVVMRDLDPGR
jgi:hypothetical protein